MKVLYCTSEARPFAATGGLADVAGSLPQALRERLIGCRVVNKEGEELGTVETLETNGVQSLLAVKGEKRHLIPLIPEYVLDIDLDSELIQVEWHADWS